ncbi:MAG: transposase domain-containing protein [Saprospiraceae bacterium]|nr:transposase domain-containing protein [Candidatus Parvibacillus calidus]
MAKDQYSTHFCTCKPKGINPCEWLVDTLNKIPSHLINRIHELLPGYIQNNDVKLLGRL